MRQGIILLFFIAGFAPASSSAQSESTTGNCDIFNRIATAPHTEKLQGLSYDEVSRAFDDPSSQINQALAANSEAAQRLHDTVHLIVKKAYTTAWPSPQAFPDHELAVCLGNQ
jgi:hypothetical protein